MFAALGTPHRDAKGEIDNVVLLHGTGGDQGASMTVLVAFEVQVHWICQSTMNALVSCPEPRAVFANEAPTKLNLCFWA
jgi:hypothetical protein